MTVILMFPTRSRLGLSPTVSGDVLAECIASYNQGRAAYAEGKARKRPSWRAEVFDRESWLRGWDDAASEDKSAA